MIFLALWRAPRGSRPAFILDSMESQNFELPRFIATRTYSGQDAQGPSISAAHMMTAHRWDGNYRYRTEALAALGQVVLQPGESSSALESLDGGITHRSV